MKLRGVLLLIIFLSFIISPTALCIANGNSDIKPYFSLMESEKNIEEELKKMETKSINDYMSLPISDAPDPFNKSKFYINTFSFNNLYKDIFIPPPNQF
jgi:hypothetical protein